jgi:hypothetical protein
VAGFDDAWNAVSRPRYGEPVSPNLRPLLRRVYKRSPSCPRTGAQQTCKAAIQTNNVEMNDRLTSHR